MIEIAVGGVEPRYVCWFAARRLLVVGERAWGRLGRDPSWRIRDPAGREVFCPSDPYRLVAFGAAHRALIAAEARRELWTGEIGISYKGEYLMMSDEYDSA